MSAQTIKLELIKDASEAYPGRSINDALYLFLQQMYNTGQGLPDLLAKYGEYTLNTDGLFVQNGKLVSAGALTTGSLLWSS